MEEKKKIRKLRRSPRQFTGVPVCGTKPKYTPEFLDALADEMYEEIVKDKTILFVRRFFTKKGIYFPVVYDILHISEKFEKTFRMCQQICADRVHQGVLHGKLDGRYAVRFMHFFDKELNEKDKENEKKKLEQTLTVTKESSINPDGMKIILEVEKV